MTFAETASSSTTRPLVEESAASRIPVNGRLAKSLDLLEFPAVRERLARYASCPLGVDLALALVPSSDAAVVERLGLETAEARALLSEGVDISFPGVVHVQAHVGRAAKSGTLTGLELREVYTALQGAHQARQTLVRRRASRPLLASIAGRVPELQDLAKAIAQAIGTQGEVTDSASPLLREVRSEARIVYQRLED
ncbi:MAG: hypothetical protein FJ315_02535, partial [SAR202 cluster bacterium]|nr:hypothetical protein [SAR202 cluster bacterium]